MMAKATVLALGLLLAACAGNPPLTPPEPGQAEKAARINTQLAVAYMREGQLDQASQKLGRALQQAPELADAHVTAAVLYERLGELDKAARHHRRAVQLAPDDPAAHNNYGRFLCNLGKTDEALPYLEKAAGNPLYRSPELPLGNAGLCLLEAGDPARAEPYLLRALRANPQFAPALLPMARIRFDAGDPLSARGFYQRYAAIAPQTPQSLWLGLQIERALGNRDAVASYALLLRNKFPDSEEARRLSEVHGNDR